MPAPPTAVTEPYAGTAARRPRYGRRMWWLVAAAAAVVLLAAAGAVSLAMRNGPVRLAAPLASHRAANPPAGSPANPPANPPAGAPATPVRCRYEAAPGGSEIGAPPVTAARTGPVRVTLRTNEGAIELSLDAAKAPCAVNSFAHLAGVGFFNDSACHRLTTSGIFVLQCGDPTASGAGGPGYRFADENLPVNAKPAYPRGTVAMANAGPGTNGSQFFLVYRDSDIDPNYPVLGRVTAGLDIVERVAAGGAPNNDGPPEIEIVIESAEVTG